MTPRQIDLVRSSCAQASMLADQPVALFMDHLFEAEPALRDEWLEDPQRQGDRLMRMLTGTLMLLDRPTELQAALEVLGARLHATEHPRRRQQLLSAALIRTLEACLQAAFTPEVREAWLALCALAGQSLARRAPALSLAAA